MATHESGDGATSGNALIGVANSDRHDLTLLMSYRFLRCGIVAAAVTLVVSVVFEIVQTGCVRNSISVYFYSPVRTIFTGSLMAVGLCLVILQGDNDIEEVSLNLAGLFAPMVAVVPTGLSTVCDARFANLSDPERNTLVAGIEAATRDGLQNNLVAYFGVVLVALVLLLVFPRQFVRDGTRLIWMRVAVVGYIVVVAAFAVSAWRVSSGEQSWAHNLAAILMFVAFGVVVAHNGWFRGHVPGWYQNACRAIVVAMVGAVLVFFWMRSQDVSWALFALEAAELVLFATFWLVQTIVFWQRDVITGDHLDVASAGDPSPAPTAATG